MTVSLALLRRGASLFWPVIGLAALVAALLSPNVHWLVATAVAQVRLTAVLATLPGQAAAALLCGGALFVLCPGASFKTALLSRLLRDAGANLLLFMPGLGEVIGARALVLAGGRARSAVAATVLDNLAESLAQAPFAALSLLILWRSPLGGASMSASLEGALPWAGAAAALLLASAALCLSGPVRTAARRLAAWAAAELRHVRRELHTRRRRFAVATALHGCAWLMGGVQLWMIGRALAIPIGLGPAIVVESAAYAVRAIVFFIPAGVVVQETALVLAGISYGLTPAQSLAIALVLRLRDILFGAPLLLWPLLELRRAARARSPKADA